MIGVEKTLKEIVQSIKVRGNFVILQVPRLSKTMGTTGVVIKPQEQIDRERNELTSRNKLYEVIAVGHLVTDWKIGDKCFVMPHVITSFIDRKEDESLIYCREDDIIGSIQRNSFEFKVPVPTHYPLTKKEAQAMNRGDDFLATE